MFLKQHGKNVATTYKLHIASFLSGRDVSKNTWVLPQKTHGLLYTNNNSVKHNLSFHCANWSQEVWQESGSAAASSTYIQEVQVQTLDRFQLWDI